MDIFYWITGTKKAPLFFHSIEFQERRPITGEADYVKWIPLRVLVWRRRRFRLQLTRVITARSTSYVRTCTNDLSHRCSVLRAKLNFYYAAVTRLKLELQASDARDFGFDYHRGVICF
ncbi:hypothetical protein EVAR_99217_1 [Eumeta japonica]|uniref:Uncharacterized protein n=1 Tax=Eumeta variegata TaxID=151549 RepID=A0A4C1YML3_EUMVA|nr:hypothetical protein EVAR_99217_1 [Eumeta japonica]